MEPSDITPHAAAKPALMDKKVPVGGVASAGLLFPPQQATVPSVLIPHATSLPTVTEMKFPDGGLA
jgi:hypothetical protein